jgi:hypothetical protein
MMRRHRSFSTWLSTCLVLLAGLAARGAFAVQAPAIQPSGPPLLLTADPLGAHSPSVTADRAGNFFAVWVGHDQNGATALLLRRLSISGQPLGSAIVVDQAGGYSGQPRIATAPGGGMVVAWTRAGDVPRARLLTSDGQPAGGAFALTDVHFCCDEISDVAFLSSGDFVAIWEKLEVNAFIVDPYTAQIFDPAGHPRGDAFTVNPFTASREPARVAADPSGGFAVAWQTDPIDPDRAVIFRRFTADGSPRGSEMTAAAEAGIRPVPVFSPQGELTILWNHPSALLYVDPSGIFARRFAADNSPLGAKFLLAAGPTFDAPADVADGHQGRRVLVWAANNTVPDNLARIFVRSFDSSWQPLGPPLATAGFRVHLNHYGLEEGPSPAIAAGPSGFFTVWDQLPSPSSAPSSPVLQVAAQPLSGPCVADAHDLCLEEGRFRVAVAWNDPRNAASGTGNTLPLTGDTGAFWFFSPDNAELLLKVLDGRPVNGNWWVFFGALSDVEYDVTVTDTWTGAQKTYHNPAYTLAGRADVQAFAEEPDPAQSTAAGPAPAESVAHPGRDCTAGACIGPFEVSVDFTDPATDEVKTAHGAPLGSESSVFWFFSPENLELIVKVLDGRAVNGHYWVFYGALSDVDYTIRVTKTDQGVTRSYHNPHGIIASRADTNAF